MTVQLTVTNLLRTDTPARFPTVRNVSAEHLGQAFPPCPHSAFPCDHAEHTVAPCLSDGVVDLWFQTVIQHG